MSPLAIALILALAPTAPAPPASKLAARPGKPARAQTVELNTASRAELMKLPGVDATLADAIIQGRPYRTKTNLVTRRIMPQALYASLRHLVSARQPSAPSRKQP